MIYIKMSADFDTKLLYDSRLNDIDTKISYGVQKGPSKNNFQTFVANSISNTSLTFSVNPPSESTVVDRHILFDSTLYFNIIIGTDAAGPGALPGQATNGWLYGLRDSLQSFPFSRLVATMTAMVNQSSVSVSLQRVMPALIRLLDKEFCQDYNGFSPTYPDNFANLQDGVLGTTNSAMNSFDRSGLNDTLQGRGAHPISHFYLARYVAGAYQDASPLTTNPFNDNKFVLNIGVKISEPLMLSPFIYGDSMYNQAGFLGINNFSLDINIDPTLRNLWSTGLPNGTSVVLAPGVVRVPDGGGAVNAPVVGFGAGVNLFENPRLLITFLSAPLPMILPPKNVLPLSHVQLYETTGLAQLVAANYDTQVNGTKLFASGESPISAISLEVIPDLICVYVRRKWSDQNALTSDTFLSISGIDITWANNSGILASAKPEELYLMSKRNGLKMDWNAFRGVAGGTGGGTAPRTNVQYGTAGTLLVMSPALDWSMGEVFLANGSIGQFQLQMNVKYTNRYSVDVLPEICVVAIRNGMFISTAGQSSLTYNMLNSSIVTETIERDKNPMGTEYHTRLLGGESNPSAMPAAGEGGARSGGARSAGKRSKLSSLVI